ncbi:hypothetical protein RFI_16783 [Reticulomyxa filosa]|uniref:Uncharacterized protein n=1 Tax=Reticulomyxa filosa TaxID=46433 RepID=X6N549_RETFI|nr:hypothetical protein RFI_16783 [Reticulomyxa filosa]|eukprot:ETO20432.1 hypothetical protein RFI_16783 [Reticulomyxa filosa]
MKQLSLEDKSIKDKIFDLTQQLLYYEQKGSGSEQSLEVWIQLFNCKVEHNVNEWNKQLTASLRTWFNSADLDGLLCNNCYHRKALWLLADSRWNLLPTACRNELEKCLESKAKYFQYQNKCWTDKDRSQLDQCIGKPPWNSTKWNWFLSLFLKYQDQKLVLLYTFTTVIPTFAIDSDEKKESQTVDQKYRLSSTQTDQLLDELKQCISYTRWKNILHNHQHIEILKQQWLSIQDTLVTLHDVIKVGKANFALCEFIKRDSNEKCIEELAGRLFDQQTWITTMEKFKNLKKWNDILGQLLAEKYLEKVPSDLENFYNFFRASRYEWISEMEITMEKEIRLLECFHDEWQVMIDRKDIQTFRTIWDICKEQFQTLQCLKIQFQSDQVNLNPELEIQLSRFIKCTPKQIIRRIMTAWRHLAKKAKLMHMQPTTLIPIHLQNKYFFSDELAYFPQDFFSWKYCVAAYNFALSLSNELYKTNADSITPTSAIDFIEVFENANLRWEEKTKNGNESLETLEAERKKLQQLQDMWKQLKLGVEVIQKYHEGKKDMSDEVEIEETNNAYKQCMEQFRDMIKYVHVLELIARNEQQIKEIATNHAFTNDKLFSFGLQRLKDCGNEHFYRLIEPLRIVNQTMQEKIWNVKFKETDALAKAILELIDHNKEWGKYMNECFKVNFHALIRVMTTGDEAVVIKKYDTFEKASRKGNWVLSGYNGIYISRSSSNKYEGLTLEFEGMQLTYEYIGHSIDQLKLGLMSAQQEKIVNIISQFEICKDLCAIRMDYWEKGGIGDRTSLTLQANAPIDLFYKKKKEWEEILNKWNNECIQLRHICPCLTYFTMNEAQQLINNLNCIIQHEKQHWNILASKYIVPFLQRLDYKFNDASAMLSEWADAHTDGIRSLQELGRIFSNVWIKSKNNETASYSSFSSSSFLQSLKTGRPNLVIVNNNNPLFSVLSLYESIGLIPRAEHILLCKEITTEEEVECLLLRALLYVKSNKSINVKVPLYCLVWPEKLEARTLAKVVKLFQKYIFDPSQSQQTQSYLFAVVSSDRDNELSQILKEFEWSVSGERVNPNFGTHDMYARELDLLTTKKADQKPFVRLYETWTIRQDIKALEQISKIQSVCIRFNSRDIDWENTAKTLWKYHPCQAHNVSKENSESIEKNMENLKYSKDNWIVYHIDVSSCVNKDINNFFFQLLYLQRIDTMNYSFHVNPNMIFFIEIPSKIDTFLDTPHNFFYILFFKMPFANETKLSLFNTGDKGQFSIKWMEEFFSGKLKSFFVYQFFFFFNKKNRQRNFVINIFKNLIQQIATTTPDIDVESKPKLNPTAINEFMRNHFSHLKSSSPWYYVMFFNFLFVQFRFWPNHNSFWITAFHFDLKRPSVSLHLPKIYALSLIMKMIPKWYTRSNFICVKSGNNQKKYCFFAFILFYFVVKLYIKIYIYIIDRKPGSISLLAATMEQLNDKRLKPLRQIDCPAIAWEQEVKNTWNDQQKKERIKFLFRAVNVPVEKRSEIQRLCDTNFKYYVLTYDNILKMLAILLKIRSNLPVCVLFHRYKPYNGKKKTYNCLLVV